MTPNIKASEVKKKTWEKRLDAAKLKDRPKLKDWGRDGFFSVRKEDFLQLRHQKLQCREITDKIFLKEQSERLKDVKNYGTGTIMIPKNQMIDKFDRDIADVRTFINAYEKPAIPCIITRIPIVEKWEGFERWNLHDLKRFKNRYFKVGEDDDGFKLKVRMKYFLKYLKYNSDDSPLVIFDSNFYTDHESKLLMDEFRVPSYFPEDLFELVGEKRRPPHLWFLLGPERSGTCVHIDPLGTSAWNTVIRGRKRWILFPPNTSKTIVKGTDVIIKGEDDEAINYFVDIVPRIKKKYGHEIHMFEFFQEEGETVFVPGGWWHAVLNVENSIAVTQNYCSHANFERVWVRTRSGRKKMAVKWLNQLKIHNPDLAEIAENLNRKDDFQMFDPEDGSSSSKKGSKRKREEAAE